MSPYGSTQKWDISNVYIAQISTMHFSRKNCHPARGMDICISRLVRLLFETGMCSNALAHAYLPPCMHSFKFEFMAVIFAFYDGKKLNGY